jgi:hypothetical protein
MPINYSADQFSNALQGTVDNGFEFFTTPMYVNCPDIGLVGEETNPLKSESFETAIMLGDSTSFTLIGTSPNLIFQADQTIMFVAVPSNITIGETTTNIMGGYEYDLEASDIPDDTFEIEVVYDGESIRSILVTMMVEDGDGSDGTGDESEGGSGSGNVDSSPSSAMQFMPGFFTGAALIAITSVVV